jgi:hypothetical protein
MGEEMCTLMARKHGTNASRPPQFSVKGLFVVTACIAINLAIVRHDPGLYYYCSAIWLTLGFSWLLNCAAFLLDCTATDSLLLKRTHRRPGEFRLRPRTSLSPVPYVGLVAALTSYLYVAHYALLHIFLAPSFGRWFFYSDFRPKLVFWSASMNISFLIFVLAATLVCLANGGGRSLAHRFTIAAALAILTLSWFAGR